MTIHEYGHFQVARWCGVKVLRFSIGFGKPLWQKSFSTDKTEFVLAAIPLGGYVKMLDERELKAEKEAGDSGEAEYSKAELARAFNRQSVFKRIAIVLAGPLANLLLAILIYWILMMQGTTGMRPIIGEVAPGSIAAKANFHIRDTIQAIDGQEVNTWRDASWALLNAAVANKTIEVATINDGQKAVKKLNLNGLGKDVEVDILDKIGFQAFMPNIDPIVEQVIKGGAAEKSGLIVGDKIISIDGVKTSTWDAVVAIVQANPNQVLAFELGRQDGIVRAMVTPKPEQERGVMVGKIGVAVKLDQSMLTPFQVKQHYSTSESFKLAVSKTWDMSTFSLKMMWYMVTGQTSWKSISGPVTIASYAGQSAGLGLNAFLGFMALVSISIGVLNLLPIPVLDGGHLMYYIAEIVKGSAVSEQAMLLGQKIGLGLLGLLMTLAIFNDINRIAAG